jgi:hypothetical protein
VVLVAAAMGVRVPPPRESDPAHEPVEALPTVHHPH